MEYEEVVKLFICALEKLNKFDSKLLEDNVSEWAIAHRLAVHLEKIFPSGWNVDCEYNRQGNEEMKKMLKNGEIVRPDIIIHHRRCLEPEHNLLVIELKKKEEGADSGKVIEYTKPPDNHRKFQYQYGLTYSIESNALVWFSDGKKIMN